MARAYFQYCFGALLKIISLIFFCVMTIKFKMSKCDAITQLFIVYAIGIISLLPIMFYGKLFNISDKRLFVYLQRCVISVLVMLCWIEVVKYFGANQSILVLYVTPLISVLLASLLSAEKLNIQCFIVSMSCYLVLDIALKTEMTTSLYGFSMAILSSIL